jgi:Uma2 family endonuclease
MSILAKDNIRRLVMPVSVEQYHQFSAAGLISEKTELINGIIFNKMTKSPLHEFIAYRLFRYFSDGLDDAYLIRKEAPLTLASSEPEPDISILRGRIEQFVSAHPSYAELVIEIALSSLDLDREKSLIYAAANIPEYWIVLPDRQLIERYNTPVAGKYQSKTRLTATESIQTLCGELPLQALFKTAAK